MHSPPAGKGNGVGCVASQVADNGRKLGVLTAVQIGSRDVQHNLSGGEEARADAGG